jgi:hypothetical protein
VSEPMEQMAQLLRAGEAPSDLMATYAARDAKRPRNDPCPCGNGRKWKHCHGSSLPVPTTWSRPHSADSGQPIATGG